MVEIGEPDRVVAKYLAAMTEKDSTYLHAQGGRRREARRARGRCCAPEMVETIPNIDHRYGDGRAEVMGIAVLDEHGEPLHLLEPRARIVVRISVRAKDDVPLPMVGFMLRNQLGMDFSGTNTAREGYELPPMQPGDIYTVDFHLDLPELYPASFSFSPAIADGTLLGYPMCDWIDNAVALQMSARRERDLRLPPSALPRGSERAHCSEPDGPRPCWRNALAEFTGERVIPGQVDVDLLNEHLARYAFAARLARGKRVLDAGCGAGYGSAELARTARFGGRASTAPPEAVEFARANYRLPNLALRAGVLHRAAASPTAASTWWWRSK